MKTVLGPRRREDSRPVIFGAVKTNIAHLEAAAGLAGMIKAALALQHRCVPGNLHFKELNPHIDVHDIDAVFLTKKAELPLAVVAGVSSFGGRCEQCQSSPGGGWRSWKALNLFHASTSGVIAGAGVGAAAASVADVPAASLTSNIFRPER